MEIIYNTKSFYKIFNIKIFFIFLLIIKIITYKKPKLSVIVPIYNIEKYYLNKILDLLMIQPLKEVEFILIDDKSTDGTGKYIEKFTKMDNRFLIIHNYINLGIATSRNIGLNFVVSDYLTFSDDDDIFDIDSYKIIINEMEKDSSIDLTQFKFIGLYNDQDHLKPYSLYKQPTLNYSLVSDQLSNNLCCTVWDKIFKTETIFKYQLYFPKTPIFEDGYFLNMISPYIKNKKFINEIFYFWRQRKSSFSHTRNLNISTQIKSIKYSLPRVFESWNKNNVLKNNCKIFCYVFSLDYNFLFKENELLIITALNIFKRYRNMFNLKCIRSSSLEYRMLFIKNLYYFKDWKINIYENIIKNKNFCYF